VRSTNVTLPVGAAVEGAIAVTSAVNVITSPYADGFGDDDSAVVVAAGFTIWVIESELPAKSTLGLYVASTTWLPAANTLVNRRASPIPLSATVPRIVTDVVSTNVTDPMGVGNALTITVKITG
jgi:hypothetical protein